MGRRELPLVLCAAALVLLAATTAALSRLEWPEPPRPPFTVAKRHHLTSCALLTPAHADGIAQVRIASSLDMDGRAAARGDTLWVEVPSRFRSGYDVDVRLDGGRLAGVAQLGWTGRCGPVTLARK